MKMFYKHYLTNHHTTVGTFNIAEKRYTDLLTLYYTWKFMVIY